MGMRAGFSDTGESPAIYLRDDDLNRASLAFGQADACAIAEAFHTIEPDTHEWAIGTTEDGSPWLCVSDDHETLSVCRISAAHWVFERTDEVTGEHEVFAASTFADLQLHVSTNVQAFAIE